MKINDYFHRDDWEKLPEKARSGVVSYLRLLGYVVLDGWDVFDQEYRDIEDPYITTMHFLERPSLYFVEAVPDGKRITCSELVAMSRLGMYEE